MILLYLSGPLFQFLSILPPTLCISTTFTLVQATTFSTLGHCYGLKGLPTSSPYLLAPSPPSSQNSHGILLIKALQLLRTVLQKKLKMLTKAHKALPGMAATHLPLKPPWAFFCSHSFPPQGLGTSCFLSSVILLFALAHPLDFGTRTSPSERST